MSSSKIYYQLMLLRQDGSCGGRIYRVKRHQVLLGNESLCHIPLAHMSGKDQIHAKVILESDGNVFIDPIFGIYINEYAVLGYRMLEDEDTIALGGTKFKFNYQPAHMRSRATQTIEDDDEEGESTNSEPNDLNAAACSCDDPFHTPVPMTE